MVEFSVFMSTNGLLSAVGIGVIAATLWFAVRKDKSGAAPAVAHPPTEKELALSKMAHTAYALYGAAFIFPLSAIAGVVMAYLKHSEAQGTWLESHFRWQIHTFWFMLLWSIIAMATFFILIGWLILAATVIWYIYRIVLGWVSLAERRPIQPGPEAMRPTMGS